MENKIVTHIFLMQVNINSAADAIFDFIGTRKYVSVFSYAVNHYRPIVRPHSLLNRLDVTEDRIVVIDSVGYHRLELGTVIDINHDTETMLIEPKEKDGSATYWVVQLESREDL